MNIEHRTSNMERRTNRRFVRNVFSIIAAAFVFSAIAAGAQSTNNNDSLPSFRSFDIIINRNIFDPNRRGFRPTRSYNNTRSPDSFALVGTMSYAKGKFAFFDSSMPQYKKVLEPGATIAGYTVKDVTPKEVLLAANTNEIAMNVGTRMVNEGGKWKLSTDMQMPSTSTSDQSSEPAADLTPPTGPNSDVLKKLMQQREQERQQLESK